MIKNFECLCVFLFELSPMKVIVIAHILNVTPGSLTIQHSPAIILSTTLSNFPALIV